MIILGVFWRLVLSTVPIDTDHQAAGSDSLTGCLGWLTRKVMYCATPPS